MAWIYQGVVNAGLQILLSIATGWVCVAWGLVSPDIIHPLNDFAFKTSIPAYILYLMGIKTDLLIAESWRSLGVWMLWVTIIQAGSIAWVLLLQPGKLAAMGQHGLVLACSNTGVIGWAVLEPLVGANLAGVAMLMGLSVFFQIIPFTITCFEWQDWINAEQQQQQQQLDEQLVVVVGTPRPPAPAGSVHPQPPDQQQQQQQQHIGLSPSKLPALHIDVPAQPDLDTQWTDWEEVVPGADTPSAAAAAAGAQGQIGSSRTPVRAVPSTPLTPAVVAAGAFGAMQPMAGQSRSMQGAPAAAAPAAATLLAGRYAVSASPAARAEGLQGSSVEAIPHDTASSSTAAAADQVQASARGRQSGTKRDQQQPRAVHRSHSTDFWYQRRRRALRTSVGGAGGGVASPNAYQPFASAAGLLNRRSQLLGKSPTIGEVELGEGSQGEGRSSVEKQGLLDPSAAASSSSSRSSGDSASSSGLDTRQDAWVQQSQPGMGVSRAESAAVAASSAVPAGASTPGSSLGRAARLLLPHSNSQGPTSCQAAAFRGTPRAPIRPSPFTNPQAAHAALGDRTPPPPSPSGSMLQWQQTQSSGLTTPRRRPTAAGELLSQAWGASLGACVSPTTHPPHRRVQSPGVYDEQRVSPGYPILNRISSLVTGQWTPRTAATPRQPNPRADTPAGGATGRGWLGGTPISRNSQHAGVPIRGSTPQQNVLIDQGVGEASDSGDEGPAAAGEWLGDLRLLLPTRWDSAAGPAPQQAGGGAAEGRGQVAQGVGHSSRQVEEPQGGAAIAIQQQQEQMVLVQPSHSWSGSVLPYWEQGGGGSEGGQLSRTVTSNVSRVSGASRVPPGRLGPLRTLRQFCKEQAAQHAALTHLASVQLKNHLLWVNLVAVVISVSGLRRWLDPASPAAVPGLAWVAGTLDWYSRCTMALLLFSNGAWMHGKQLLKDNLREVVGYLLVRLAVLPPLMAVLAWACGLDAQRQLVLVVLAACPLAQLGFAVSEKYGRGAETASAVIVFGVLLMLPHIIGVLQALAALGIAHL